MTDDAKKSGKNRKRRGRGEGGIFERDDGQWVGQLDLGRDANNKRRRKVVYGATKKEVQTKLLQLQQQGLTGSVEASTMTVRATLELWLASVKGNVGASTYDRYKLDVDKHLIPRLGRLRLGDLKAMHVSQLYRDMAAAGSTPDAQRKAGTVLRQALRQAVNFDMIPNNPALKTPLPRVEREEIRPLTPEEIPVLLAAAAADRLYALYVLALDSGMRQGELLALTWNDVEFERGEVVVTKSLSEVRGALAVKETKTKKGRRRIRVAPSTLKELKAHRERMKKEGHGSELVFPSATGTHFRKSNLLRRNFFPATERAGFPKLRFHDMRHTCATLLLLNGVNIKAVSERMGHARIEITLSTYSHVLPTMQEQAASIMETILNPPEKPATPPKVAKAG